MGHTFAKPSKFVIQTPNGRRYEASTLRGALDELRAAAIGYHDVDGTIPTEREYMRLVARRVFEWDGATVDTSTIEAFCSSMVAAGQFKIEAGDSGPDPAGGASLQGPQLVVRAPGPEGLADTTPAEQMSAEARANPLAEYFLANRGRLLHKWHHYFEIYHRHLERFCGNSPVVLEVGVSHGGSLQMWHSYFGKGARVIGVDINPRCREFEDDNTTILIGDQEDPAFLADIRERFPHIDIIIDDGGHTMTQQITTLGELYFHVQPRGVYICEDLHTSYWPSFGGGLRRDGTFIEFSKHLIDGLHGWYYSPKGKELDAYTAGTFGVSFYDSIVVIEKRPIGKPLVSVTGKPSFETW